MTDVVLRCPEGAWDYPISHGTRSFFPYRADITSEDAREFGGPWHVRVPIDIAHHFMKAGFVLMAESQEGEIPETVRLKSPTGQGCVWGDPSQTYEADADGVVTVPYEAMSVLTGSMGFVVVPEEAEAETKAEAKSAAREEPEEHEPPRERRAAESDYSRGGRVPRR